MKSEIPKKVFEIMFFFQFFFQNFWQRFLAKVFGKVLCAKNIIFNFFIVIFLKNNIKYTIIL